MCVCAGRYSSLLCQTTSQSEDKERTRCEKYLPSFPSFLLHSLSLPFPSFPSVSQSIPSSLYLSLHPSLPPPLFFPLSLTIPPSTHPLSSHPFPPPPTYSTMKMRQSIQSCIVSQTMLKEVIRTLQNHFKLVMTSLQQLICLHSCINIVQVVLFTFLYKHCTGRILSIYQRSGSKLTSEPKLYLKLAMFYRPEDTHKGLEASRQTDMSLLYWGDEGE